MSEYAWVLNIWEYARDLNMSQYTSIFRSSRPEVFCKKGVPRNFAKRTGKHLCQRPFFNKVAGLRPAVMLLNIPEQT